MSADYYKTDEGYVLEYDGLTTFLPFKYSGGLCVTDTFMDDLVDGLNDGTIPLLFNNNLISPENLVKILYETIEETKNIKFTIVDKNNKSI